HKKQLQDRLWIYFKSDDSLQDFIYHWLYYQQKDINALQKISVDQIETYKQFMKQGLGMAILPKSVSHNLMAKYPHLPLEMEGKHVTRDTWLCSQSGIRQLP